MMKAVLLSVLFSVLEVLPAGKAFLKSVEPSDSILIADRVEYGFCLEQVVSGTGLALPDFKSVSNDTLTLVEGWKLDTLRDGRGELCDIRASVVLAPFEEGKYELPDIQVLKSVGGRTDTLLFEGVGMDVRSVPVDTATFKPNDIKGLIVYPLTFAETLPYAFGALFLAAVAVLAVWLVRRAKRRAAAALRQDPPHIVALRELDKFRSEKYWTPEMQKSFYSGVTDALKAYIDARFGVDAPEMTTAELFKSLEREKDIRIETYNELKDLFVRADFVKFAKSLADDSENALVLPLAIRFVMETYSVGIENESKAEEASAG